MDYLKIKLSILNVYKECDIHSFPINCFGLLEAYGFKHKSYNSQTSKKKEKCFLVSDDAFTARKTVFYNDEMPNGRIRFSLMHELAHFILGHAEPRTELHEKEADFFASHILAPRMAIHYAKCKNAKDVSRTFELTYEASDYAFQDYRRWHRYVVYHKMSTADKAMYNYFFNSEQDCFVYSIKECDICGKMLFNSIKNSCTAHHFFFEPRTCYEPDPLEKDLLVAEKQWLYGWL